MTTTIIFLTLGLILLGVLLAIAFFSEHLEGSFARDTSEGEVFPAVFTDLDLNFPSRLLADRIFAQGDLDFVSRQVPSLEKDFVQERKKVALMWLRDTRICMGRIFRFYGIVSRSNPALELRTEIRMASNYALVICIIFSLGVLINLLGPFRVRGMVTRMFVLANGISMGVGQMLAALDQPSLVKIKDDWAQQSGLGD